VIVLVEEKKVLTIEDVKTEATKNKIQIIEPSGKRKDYIRFDDITVLNAKYGVAWRSSEGTKRIETIEQLKEQFKGLKTKE